MHPEMGTIVLAQAEPDLPFIGNVDLVDGIGADIERAQLVDHTAVRGVTKKRESGDRGLRDNRSEDVGDVGQIGGGALVVDALPFDLRTGQQRVNHGPGMEFPDRLELVDEVVVEVGLFAQLST